jgi:hypothetical protein
VRRVLVLFEELDFVVEVRDLVEAKVRMAPLVGTGERVIELITTMSDDVRDRSKAHTDRDHRDEATGDLRVAENLRTWRMARGLEILGGATHPCRLWSSEIKTKSL